MCPLKLLHFVYVCVYVRMCVCIQVCTIAHVWRSEDNWWELVLIVCHVHPGRHDPQVLRLGVRHLCPPSMSPAHRMGSFLLMLTNKGSAGRNSSSWFLGDGNPWLTAVVADPLNVVKGRENGYVVSFTFAILYRFRDHMIKAAKRNWGNQVCNKNSKLVKV